MKTNIRWTTSIVALLLVVAIAFLLAACGGDDGAASEIPTEDSADTSVDGDDHEADGHATDVDDHDAAIGHDADADDHDADTDEEEFAYLEAAPKDVLYLVEMTNFAFTPEVLEVGVGEVLEIAIQNVEAVLHDFTIDEIDADVHISYLGGTGQHAHAELERDADVHFALTEPGSGVVHIKVHEPGEYVIYCSVPGHREAGMEGTLIVR